MRIVVICAVWDKPGTIATTDGQQYLALANNLAFNGVFSRSQSAPFTPESFRTPGYPAFIALLVLIRGRNPLIPLVIAQGIIGVFTVAGIIWLGKLLFGPRIGIIAGIIFALSPIPAIMTGYANSETLFSACVVCGSLLLIWGIRSNKWTISLLSGLVFGVAPLIRPIGIVMLPVLPLLPIVSQPLRDSWRKVLAVTLTSALLPCAWMARNALIFDHFELASVSNGNLFYYNVAGAEAHRRGITLSESRRQLKEQLAKFNYTTNDAWPAANKKALALEIIRAHPLSFIWWNGIDALNGFRPGFSFLLELSETSSSIRTPVKIFRKGDIDISAVLAAIRTQPLPLILIEFYMLIFIAGLVIFCISGLITLLAGKRWAEVALLFLLPAALLYAPGAASNARFRSAVEPFLAILAAVGVSGIQAALLTWHNRIRQPNT
jgi:4-amino-4-deoxy-L-arabinose transferase-like glycosyltransferase